MTMPTEYQTHHHNYSQETEKEICFPIHHHSLSLSRSVSPLSFSSNLPSASNSMTDSEALQTPRSSTKYIPIDIQKTEPPYSPPEVPPKTNQPFLSPSSKELVSSPSGNENENENEKSENSCHLDAHPIPFPTPLPRPKPKAKEKEKRIPLHQTLQQIQPFPPPRTPKMKPPQPPKKAPKTKSSRKRKLTKARSTLYILLAILSLFAILGICTILAGNVLSQGKVSVEVHDTNSSPGATAAATGDGVVWGAGWEPGTTGHGVFEVKTGSEMGPEATILVLPSVTMLDFKSVDTCGGPDCATVVVGSKTAAVFTGSAVGPTAMGMSIVTRTVTASFSTITSLSR